MPFDPTKLALAAQRAESVHKTYFKKNKRRLEKMDLQVQQLHESATAVHDCLACANCCRTLGPAIYDRDIARIAEALRIKPSEVVAQYLRVDSDGDYVFRTIPCPFLMPDNYCSIYPARPKACREYPHTDRKRFSQIYMLTVRNAATCPIAFDVLQGVIKL